MSKFLSMPVVAAASLLLCQQHAWADQIEIAGEAYAQLPANAQESLVAKMKEQGLISKDDTVKYVGPAVSGGKESLGPAVLITLAPAVCKLIATTKKQDDIAKCASRTEVAAQDQCKQDVETKFASIDAVCNVIKLF